MPSFAHLHVHTEYSLLDGLSRISQLIAQAKALGMDTLAVTDHGAMYAAIEFYTKAKEAGIKPIIGCEAYMARRGRQQREPRLDNNPYHLTLLAQDRAGYKNLIKLSTEAHLSGYYYRPRLDRELLAEHTKGLIVLSGCPSAEIPRLLLDGNLEGARRSAAWFKEVFGPQRFYIELQEHGIPEHAGLPRMLVDLARELELPLVATNDVHYTLPTDVHPHEVLLCIQTNTSIEDPNRMRYGESFYLKSPQEMAALFPELPEAVNNTAAIAEMCNLRLDFNRLHLPDFAVPEGETVDSYLARRCWEGLQRRYHPPTEAPSRLTSRNGGRDGASTPQAEERLRYELSVIEKTGFALYILIVADFVDYARQNGILFGVRGSAAASIACYCLGITDIDPLEWNLAFERFLNVERRQMPDIDMDFADDRRGEMIEYVVKKYGRDHVAQIITFGTLGARAAIRDVGRVLGVPLGIVDQVAKLVPPVPVGINIERAMEVNPELRARYQADTMIRTLIDTAKGVEGVARNASTHAAGVVISRDPLIEHVPLQKPTKPAGKAGNEDTPSVLMTQYPMEALEKIGLLKMDFLGLANLTILGRTVEIIRQTRGLEIDLQKIPPDDPATFQMLGEGETTSIFQLEGSGMRRYVKELKPNSIADLAAMVALYRPGPMQSIPQYIRAKHGEIPITYLHPRLKSILEPTYGILVYQDQVLFIAREVAGYSLGRADVLRKAMGKKIKEEMAGEQSGFLEGARKNGIGPDTALQIWNLIEPFAGYGFNKCVIGDTRVLDYDTGQMVTVADLWRRHQASLPLGRTLTLKEDYKLGPGAISSVACNGVKQVYRLTTRTGRSITATANHPFLQFDGWRNLGDLSPGDRIAIPRRLLYQASQTADEHKLAVLGYLLAEGNLCHPYGFYFYSKSEQEYADYITYLERFANTKGTVNTSKSAASVYAGRVDLRQPSEAVEWIKSLRLDGKKATEKFVPAFVFGLSLEQIAVVLGKLFQGDGCIVNDAKRRHYACFYATSSLQLAQDIQHLLLRLNIRSVLYEKQFKYRGTLKPGYVVQITDEENLRLFLHAIGKHLVGEKSTQAQRLPARYLAPFEVTPKRAVGISDTIPTEVRSLIRQEMAAHNLTVAETVCHTGLAERLFYLDERKRGFTRPVVRILAEDLDSPVLAKLANSDLFWDEVVAIEPAGEQETYDLTIADTHNFVANDIIVHNSHAACYAMIAYQTAYLKANYPVEYMCAVLQSAMGNLEKVATAVAECRRLDILVLPPDINRSGVDFTIESTPGTGRGQAIRFALAAIKNVGEGAVGEMVAAREKGGPFQSTDDFSRRAGVQALNKRVMESLIKAGAFDGMARRSQLLAVLDRLISTSQATQHARDIGQASLFDFMPSVVAVLLVALPDVPEADYKEKLAWEKEFLGTYLSEHPLQKVALQLKDSTTTLCGEIDLEMEGQTVGVAGMITNLRRITTKKGDLMLFVQLEDLQGSIEVTVFPRVYEKTKDVWAMDRIVLVKGKVDVRNDRPQIICEAAAEYRVDESANQRISESTEQAIKKSANRQISRSADQKIANRKSEIENRTAHLHITLTRSGDTAADMKRLQAVKDVLQRYHGQDQFSLYLRNGQDQVTLRVPQATTRYCPEVEQELSSILGPGKVKVEKG